MQYVNGVWRRNRIHMMRRLPSGRVEEDVYRADLAAFVKKDDFLKVEAKVRQSSSVSSAKIDGDYARISFRESWIRRQLCGPDGFFAHHGIEVFEADVDPVRRFMIDAGADVQRPRACFLDLEWDGRVPFAQKERARILYWSLESEAGSSVYEILDDDDDRAECVILESLAEELDTFDVVLAWNGDRADFEILKARIERVGARLDMRSKLWLDHMQLFKKYNITTSDSGDEKQSAALERVAMSLPGVRKILGESAKHEEFGVGELEGVKVTGGNAWRFWMAGGENREIGSRYNRRDSFAARLIERETGYAEILFEVARTCGVFPDSRGMKAVKQFETYVMRLGAKRGVRAPTKWGGDFDDEGDRKKFRGAHVREVEDVGLLRGVHVCDFSGMYPNIMVSLNMSFDTRAPEHDVVIADQSEMPPPPPSGYTISPITGKAFRLEPLGMFVSAEWDMMQQRAFWNVEKDKHAKGTPEFKECDRRTTSYKQIINSGYGVGGSQWSRFFDPNVAESVTQTGVYLIKCVTIPAIERAGGKVVAADSVTGDRVIVVKDPTGRVRMELASELWGRANDVVRCDDGKERGRLPGWSALARSLDGSEGWFSIEAVMRHAAGKPTWRVTTKHGQTQVTTDHGIVVGGENVTPREFVERHLKFEKVDAPVPSPEPSVDLYEHVASFVDSYPYKGRSVEMRFEADQDWIWIVGWGTSRVKIRRHYQQGSAEMSALLKLVGAYVSDGSASTRATACRYMLSFCKSDHSVVSEVASSLSRIATGFDVFGPYWSDTVYVVRSGTNAMACLFSALCGSGSRNKRLPSFAFDLSDDDRDVLVEALADGDGSRSRGTGEFCSFCTTSSKLAAGVSYVMNQHGLEHSFSFRESKRAWSLKIRRSPETAQYSIKAEAFEPGDGHVYDITVAGAHTFVDGIGRVLLHNTDSAFVVGISDEQFRAVVQHLNVEVYPEVMRRLGARENRMSLAYEQKLKLMISLVKKHYAGRVEHHKGKAPLPGKEVVIKGLEYKRGDAVKLARDMQEEVVHKILLIGGEVPDRYPLAAFDFLELVESWKARVLEGALDPSDYVVAQSLNKEELEDYVRKERKDGTPGSLPVHVEVAHRMRDDGMDVGHGTRVEYVVLDGHSTPIKAVPAYAHVPGTEDRHYLWESKVWPASRRVLEVCFPSFRWDRFDVTRAVSKGVGRGRVLAGQEAFGFYADDWGDGAAMVRGL